MIIQTTKQMRPRDSRDFYPTPYGLCVEAIKEVSSPTVTRVLDAGAGTGHWGIAARQQWKDAFICGVDFHFESNPDPSAYNVWHYGDFLQWDTPLQFDRVIGNPPYKIAEEFIRKSWHLLAEGGEMILLLRLAFLEGQARADGLWRELPPSQVLILSQRPSFTGNGKTDATAYALFLWQKRPYAQAGTSLDFSFRYDTGWQSPQQVRLF